jgi:hypothetical protein
MSRGLRFRDEVEVLRVQPPKPVPEPERVVFPFEQSPHRTGMIELFYNGGVKHVFFASETPSRGFLIPRLPNGQIMRARITTCDKRVSLLDLNLNVRDFDTILFSLPPE